MSTEGPQHRQVPPPPHGRPAPNSPRSACSTPSTSAKTGLRAGEIRSLTIGSFGLDRDPPTVTVAPAYAKNRREAVVLLRPALAAELRERFKDRDRSQVAVNLPARSYVAKMMKADLAAARQAWVNDPINCADPAHRPTSDFLVYRDRDGLVADFHSPRHTFISMLAAGAVHPKTAQTLARHSTFALTMDRYSHTHRDAEVAALQVLPELRSASKKQAKTDDSVLADCLLENGGFGGGARGRRWIRPPLPHPAHKW